VAWGYVAHDYGPKPWYESASGGTGVLTVVCQGPGNLGPGNLGWIPLLNVYSGRIDALSEDRILKCTPYGALHF